MYQPGKSTPPHGGKLRDLSYPAQRDLTPDEADRVLQPQRDRRPDRENEQDPVSSGRGGLEMLFYGIMLIAVVGFQLLSYFEPTDNGDASPFDSPRVTSLTVDNRVDDSRQELEGDRVAKPDCPEGEPVIQARVADIEGSTLGRVQVEAESINGDWQITASGLLSGYARVHAEVEVSCR